MKQIFAMLTIVSLLFASCHKKFDYECTDKIFDQDLNLIYTSEPYYKRMTESEWNVYLAQKKTATSTTGCCKK